MARRPSSVRLSDRPSVCRSVNFCANRFFSQANGRIATKLAQDGLHVSVHTGCAQGQGQGLHSLLRFSKNLAQTPTLPPITDQYLILITFPK